MSDSRLTDMLHFLAHPLDLLSVLTCGLAFHRGDASGKAGSLLFVIGILVSIGLQRLAPASELPVLSLLCDTGFALGLLVIALRYVSFWIGFAMFAQAANLAIDAMALSEEGLDRFTFMFAQTALNWATLACILGGVIASWRGRVQAGCKEAGSCKVIAAIAPLQPAG